MATMHSPASVRHRTLHRPIAPDRNATVQALLDQIAALGARLAALEAGKQ
jgi:hypothetical protein